MGLIPEIVNRRRILDLAWWSMAISPSARFKNRMRLAAPISKQRRPLTHTESLRPLPDSIRSRKSDAQMGILTAWRRPKQNKRVRGKSGETESGFARLPRCRPAESDLARSTRKSKKSYGHQGAHFKMSAGAGSLWRRKDSRSTNWELQCAGAAAGEFRWRIPKPGSRGTASGTARGVTQSLSITQNKAGSGRRRTARRKNPPGKPLSKVAISP